MLIFWSINKIIQVFCNNLSKGKTWGLKKMEDLKQLEFLLNLIYLGLSSLAIALSTWITAWQSQ